MTIESQQDIDGLMRIGRIVAQILEQMIGAPIVVTTAHG